MMQFTKKRSVAIILSCQCLSAAAFGASNATCGAEELRAGSDSITVISSGISRSVLMFIPAAVATRRALPLVIDLHGSGGSAERQALYSHLSNVAAVNGFVVANPSGGVTLPNDLSRHYWNIPGTTLYGGGDMPMTAPDDVQFISDIIDQVADKTCIDKRRVYVAGFSGGARMTSLLACKLSTRIAAIAPVSGLRAGLASANNPAQPDPVTCQPRRAMPIVTFHGTDDAVNPSDGGGSPYWTYSIAAALERWVDLDHCENKPQEQHVALHVTLIRYDRCAQGAKIWLYRTTAPSEQGGGHAWPGASPLSGSTTSGAPQPNTPSTEISASELMWKFFRQFNLASALTD